MTEKPLIALCPLTGWATATIGKGALALTANYVTTPQELQTGGRSLIFAIHAPQARELAQALLNAAEASEMGQAPSVNRN